MADTRVAMDIIARDNASRTLDKVGSAAGNAGDSLKGMGDDASKLNAEVARLEGNLAKLRSEIAKDPTSKDLRRDFSRESRQLAFLKRVVAEIDTPSVGQKMVEGFSKALKGLPPEVAAVAAGAAALAAPFIGASVGAAVLGGVGAGGIVGGIALAAQDTRVKEAGSRLSANLSDAFGDAASPLIEPLLDGIDTLDLAGRRFASDMRANFATLAPVIRPLAQDVADFGTAVGPGLADAFRASRPVLLAAGKELPKIGDAISDSLSDISKGSDGAALGVIALSNSLQGLIRTTGQVVGGLASGYEELVKLNLEAAKIGDTFAGWIPVTGEIWKNGVRDSESALAAMHAARDGADDYAEALGRVVRKTKSLIEVNQERNASFSNAFDVQIGWADAQLDAKQGAHDLRAELIQGKRTLSDNTEEGRKNIQAALDQVSAWEQLREAQFKLTGDLGGANEAFRRNIESLQTLLLNLGYNREEVKRFIKVWQELIKQHDVELRALVVGGRKGEIKSGEADLRRDIPGRAAGGPVVAGRTYWVGENGPELVTFGAPGMVHSAAQSSAFAAGRMGADGGGLSFNQLVDAITRAVVPAVRAGLEGTTVTMDGSAVGQLQGRWADVYSRQ